MNRLSLFEQYRPATWSAVVGQDKAIRQIDTIRKRRGTLGGSSYYIPGPSGTGKTSIARLIADEVAGLNDTTEIDGRKLTVDTLDRIAADIELAKTSMFPLRHAWIVNEIQQLRGSQVTGLLSVIEPPGGLPDGVVFVFTTTTDGEEKLFDCDDAAPFLSRCARISMARRDLAEPFARRLLEIARAEGLDGQPIEKYVRLVRDNRLNFRACLQIIESGEMAS